ncbi:uncharacterized protein VICG_01886 [Vittaforma corneae ATCC 50505]|uniref:Fungal lipase-type domain-containing protein n=1 Tax=Vittaforma corneae (strain ATCC 50505) TaxID=993615 RepID=L2GJQ5_VITCO|nr:uncharacterized protein VICG_01886 [Vittaforma corneae ATCC 50505]ELA41093.1 hypothetical protein VICG_01886 [Vittaforma corneae ATCC 50505]
MLFKELSFKRSIRVKLISLKVANEDNLLSAYVMSNVRTVFIDCFEFEIEHLHQVLFESLKIMFFKPSATLIGDYDVGGVFINLKLLLEYFDSSNRSAVTFDLQVFKGPELSTAEYFEKKYTTIGNLCVEISHSKPSIASSMMSKKPSFFGKLDWIFEQFNNKYMAKILCLSFQIQQGTLLCRIKAILGFLAIQLFSKKIFPNCGGNHKDECADPYCFKNYNLLIGKKNARRLLKALYYSSAAYATSAFPNFGPKKLRNMNGIADSAVRFVLERALISESDIVEIHRGSLSSVGFVIFFDPLDRLVISFRGSCCRDDVFKILDAGYVPFLHGFAHEGFLALAINFLNEKISLILAEMKKRRCTSILFTGHSMGGAIGIMCYLILKNMPKFRSKQLDFNGSIKHLKMTVIVFSVPPILSKNLVKQHYPEIEVINYESDVVARLSYGSVLDFKYLCVSVSFAKELFSGFNKFLGRVEMIREHIRKSQMHEKLYCPGKIMHIRAGTIESKPVFKCREVSPEYFDEIRVDMRSIIDHLMYKVGNAIKYFINEQ